MNVIDELTEVFLQIRTELAGLSIASDGETRRRISSLTIEGRELLQQLSKELEAEPCPCGEKCSG